MRLLAVEDEPDLAHALLDHLRAHGHAVDHAGTLEEAEAVVRATRYDLILLDLRLPDGDGLTLLRGMRDRGSTTPVLIVTARDRIMERIEGLKAGADDYLVKPYDLDEMTARVDAILVFRLLPPPAAATLGIAELPEAAPRYLSGERELLIAKRAIGQ